MWYLNTEKANKLPAFLKSVHLGNVHFLLFAPVSARGHGKALSLSYHAIVIF